MTWIEFWTDFGPLIQTAAFVISALAGVYVIYHNGKLAKKRALIDLIMQQRADEDLNKSLRRVYELTHSSERLSKFVDLSSSNASDKSFPEDRAHILKVLNNQEFIAVGIRMGAFDESVYKELQCSNVLKLWNATSGFVYELRKIENRNTIFQDLERLANKWEKKPIKRI